MPKIIENILGHVDMRAVLKIDARIERRQSYLDPSRIGVRIAVSVDIDPCVQGRQHRNRHYNSQRKKAPAYCLYIIFKYGKNGSQILYL